MPPKVCSVEWCNSYHHANGYCVRHNMQVYNFGVIKERTRRDPNKFIVSELICEIECYDGECNIKGYAIIDIEDTEKCKPYKWCIDVKGYVVSTNKGKHIKLHQLISGLKEPDHINRNPLDNRKENLRPCTHAENCRNQKLSINNTSGYKGIIVVKGLYIAQIKKNGKNHRKPPCTSLKEAIIKYNELALELHGEFAVLHSIGDNNESTSY